MNAIKKMSLEVLEYKYIFPPPFEGTQQSIQRFLKHKQEQFEMRRHQNILNLKVFLKNPHWKHRAMEVHQLVEVSMQLMDVHQM